MLRVAPAIEWLDLELGLDGRALPQPVHLEAGARGLPTQEVEALHREKKAQRCQEEEVNGGDEDQ